MINKDDLDVCTLWVLDKLDKMDSKINALVDAHKVMGTKVFDSTDVKNAQYFRKYTLVLLYL